MCGFLMPMIEIYNELNGLQVEISDKKTDKHFDFATLYPNDKEENGEPVVIKVMGDKRNETAD